MRFFYGIVLSLMVHLILAKGLQIGAPYFETQPMKTAEVELIEAPPSIKSETPAHKRQLIREAQVPAKYLKEDDQSLARFLSASKQRVQKESRAARTGITKNSSPSHIPKSQILPRIKNYDSDNIIARTLAEGRQVFNDNSPSTFGNVVPNDVSIGSFTALNSDRYVHYTFFARVEDLIRLRWESGVRQAIDSFDRSFVLGVVGKKSWVTAVDVWLTPDGRFHSAHIMKESGLKKFDGAVTSAFQQAGLFSNPPRELVEEDGFIHLKYSFQVVFQPPTLVYQQ